MLTRSTDHSLLIGRSQAVDVTTQSRLLLIRVDGARAQASYLLYRLVTWQPTGFREVAREHGASTSTTPGAVDGNRLQVQNVLQIELFRVRLAKKLIIQRNKQSKCIR